MLFLAMTSSRVLVFWWGPLLSFHHGLTIQLLDVETNRCQRHQNYYIQWKIAGKNIEVELILYRPEEIELQEILLSLKQWLFYPFWSVPWIPFKIEIIFILVNKKYEISYLQTYSVHYNLWYLFMWINYLYNNAESVFIN